MASFYETGDSVRKTLSEGTKSINVQKGEIEDRSSVIIDSLKKYTEHNSSDAYNDFNIGLVEQAKTFQKADVSILTDTGAFSYSGREQDLVNYELSFPSKYSIDLKRLCLFLKMISTNYQKNNNKGYLIIIVSQSKFRCM